jgi:hypothetical protein
MVEHPETVRPIVRCRGRGAKTIAGVIAASHVRRLEEIQERIVWQSSTRSQRQLASDGSGAAPLADR